MKNIIKTNNELLKQALENVKPIKKRLEKDLIENYSDELFNKLDALNKEIKKAKSLIDCTSEEGAKLYAENYPDYVNKKGEINAKGIKRLSFLEKKWGFTRFFKK
jgi:hypothetical protein